MTMIDYHNPNDCWMPQPDQDPDEAMAQGCMGLVMYALTILTGLVVCALLGSCTTTQYVPVIEYKTDTLRQTIVQHDSVMVRDSTVILQQGDTIIFDHWHTEYRDRWHHDSIYIAKTDTVPRPYPVEVVKEVDRPLTWWQKLLQWAGLIAIIAVMVVVSGKLKKN